MNNNATVDKLGQMRLTGMQEAFKSILDTKLHEKYTVDEAIALIVDQEWTWRVNRKTAAAIKRAKFRYQASMEEVSFSVSRNLDKNTLHRFADGSYLEKKENIIITGATGVGKSFVASALGHQACIQGYKVIYFNAVKLFAALKMSKVDSSYAKQIKNIERQDVLILDDFGVQPLDAFSRLALLEIIEDRHGKKSTIITSQLPIGNWFELFENQTIADAILDRIIHTAHRVDLKGDSMRKKASKESLVSK